MSTQAIAARMLAGRKIALIGGAGFVGHHMALRLTALGAEVQVIDSFRVNNLHSLGLESLRQARAERHLGFVRERIALLLKAGVPVIECDAREASSLATYAGRGGWDAIVHLAAVAHADRSNVDPQTAFNNTLESLQRTLEVAVDCKSVKHFIYFSSSMVYGDFETETVTEESRCRPTNIYGALKYAGEQIVSAFGRVRELPVTIVRPSALYGPRCVSGRVVQRFLERALDREPLLLNGEPSDRLDFTFVDDLVQGVARILGSPRARGEVFNLTYGASRAMSDLVEIIEELLPGVQVVRGPRLAAMPRRGTLSVDKARELLGYEPAYALERGVRAYLAWYRQREVSAAGAATVDGSGRATGGMALPA